MNERMSLLSRLTHTIRHQKLSQDISWSMLSFFILGISGILINIIITVTRDASALAVFNLAYAVYIIGSQFAVWGVHYSVLRYAAFYHDSPAERGVMLCSASVLSLITGVILAAVIYFCEPFFTLVFHSAETGQAIGHISWGLLLFPLNKVLLAYLNGLRKIKAFSVLQALRYLVIMIVVALVSASAAPIASATYAFFVSELLTTLAAGVYICRARLIDSPGLSRAWILRHLDFGSRSLMVGMCTEINTRVDVLVIGFFLSEHATGVYSFAAMLAEGIYQVLAMVRLNFNPLLVAVIRDADWTQARNLRAQAQKYVAPLLFLLSACVLAAYWVLAAWIMPDKGLLEGMPALLILLCGMNLIATFVPFDNLLLISGHPVYQTIQHLVMLGSNVAAAFLLVPIMGIEGAATGTIIGYIAGIAVMMYFTERLLSWNLILNRVRG